MLPVGNIPKSWKLFEIYAIKRGAVAASTERGKCSAKTSPFNDEMAEESIRLMQLESQSLTVDIGWRCDAE